MLAFPNGTETYFVLRTWPFCLQIFATNLQDRHAFPDPLNFFSHHAAPSHHHMLGVRMSLSRAFPFFNIQTSKFASCTCTKNFIVFPSAEHLHTSTSRYRMVRKRFLYLCRTTSGTRVISSFDVDLYSLSEPRGSIFRAISSCSYRCSHFPTIFRPLDETRMSGRAQLKRNILE